MTNCSFPERSGLRPELSAPRGPSLAKFPRPKAKRAPRLSRSSAPRKKRRAKSDSLARAAQGLKGRSTAPRSSQSSSGRWSFRFQADRRRRPSGLPNRGPPKRGPRNRDTPGDDRATARRRSPVPRTARRPRPKCKAPRPAQASSPNAVLGRVRLGIRGAK